MKEGCIIRRGMRLTASSTYDDEEEDGALLDAFTVTTLRAMIHDLVERQLHMLADARALHHPTTPHHAQNS